ncbi:type III pantothenate kinase [Candidatus Fermentibacterales bacterium]|nr:type III pantothenate kinase [Candidatus Fermentibacterales bacterium]
MRTRIALDIGNSRTSIGLFDEDGKLLEHWRVRTEHWTEDELWLLLRQLLSLREPGYAKPEAVAFACVVPQLRHCLRGVSQRHSGRPPVEVSPATSGIVIDYPDPQELGADRIANAVGALLAGPAPAIVTDFGTATTFDVIDADGRYLGGVICPGVGTGAAELFRKAEKLSPVDLDFTDSVLARSTADAIRSGVMHSVVGSTDYILDRLEAELGSGASLYATGGWAPGIAPRCSHCLLVVPELTLQGIDAVCRRNI